MTTLKLLQKITCPKPHSRIVMLTVNCVKIQICKVYAKKIVDGRLISNKNLMFRILS